MSVVLIVCVLLFNRRVASRVWLNTDRHSDDVTVIKIKEMIF